MRIENFDHNQNERILFEKIIQQGPIDATSLLSEIGYAMNISEIGQVLQVMLEKNMIRRAEQQPNGDQTKPERVLYEAVE